MRKRLYEAFTLVEMVIVMGILIILMVVGITAGRFAINRANDVAHQNAADQIYQGLQAYYTDNRIFPSSAILVEDLLGEPGSCDDTNALCEYMDSGSFKGGTEATYYYFADDTDNAQSVLVCVTLGGVDDVRERGVYCTGNGFGDSDLSIGANTGADITDKSVPYSASGVYNTIVNLTASTWYGSSWTAPTP